MKVEGLIIKSTQGYYKKPPEVLLPYKLSRQRLKILLLFAAAFLAYPTVAGTTVGFEKSVSDNAPPIAGPDAASTNEDNPVSGNVLDNDYDPEGAPLHVVPQSKTTAHGQIEFREDGTFTYTPNPNFNGQETFEYQVCDNSSPNACCHGTLCITVLPVQDAPEAHPDFFTVNEDTPLTENVLTNDVEVDGEPLTAILGKPASHGTIDLHADGTFNYVPELNFNGTDTFTYYANDGIENSVETTVTITVLPVNDPPVALDDEITTDEDTAIGIPVLANDTDVDDVLDGTMIVVVTMPEHGTLVVNPTTGVVTYTPDLNYFGEDSFSYQIKDPHGALSGIAVVSITVEPVNDPPIAAPDFATTPEDVPVLIPVLLNDTDVDNPMTGTTLTIVNGPSHGTVVIQSPEEGILYTPEKDFNGEDSFTYTVTDADGAVSVPGTVTITVTPVNDPPVAVDDEATTLAGTSLEIPVLNNDYDVDNALVPSSISIVVSTTHGTIVINPSTGIITYTPQSGFMGSDSFSYTIQDPEGLVSNVAIVSIEVTHVNLPPVAVDDAVVQESLLSVTIDVLANDYDPDNTHDEITLVSVTNPSSGSVSIVGGKVVFQPEGAQTTVTFMYTISDPDGLTDEGKVTITLVLKDIIVSQGFSPNGDGFNDTWFIQGIENYPNNIVKVFDRWGLLVYQKEHYENNIAPWDGRANTGQQAGKLVDKGTYFYIVDPGNGLKALSGYVVIVR